MKMMNWDRFLIFNIIPVTILFNSGVANSYDDSSASSKPLMDIAYNEKHVKIKGEYIQYTKEDTTLNLPLFYTQQTDRSSGWGNNDWCNGLPKSLKDKVPPDGGWIALIYTRNHNNCSCEQKLKTARHHNASAAIVLLPQKGDDHCSKHKQQYVDIVGVTVDDQNEVSKLNQICQSIHPNEMYCTIKRQPKQHDKQFRVSKTSVLFVLVSFILLMCISLAWLVFYYVQRFRHIYRNDRKEKQLLSAAKKAISKLKTISFNAATLEGEEDSCAVCLENYKDGESIRILPCKHLFHKTCIDPWLLNHRTCPMCKSNILKSLGVEIPDNMDLSQYDMESRRISREVLGDNVNVQSSPATSSPQHHGDLDQGEHAMVGVEVSGVGSGDLHDELPHTCDIPSTSVFTPGASSSQAWSEEPNVVSASVCSSTSSMLSDTDSERSTVALVSVVQKV